MNVFVSRLCSSEVNQFISSLDEDFAEHLSRYIDIPSYSIKLATYANFVLVQINNVTVGLLAFYINDQNKELFIPYLCVSSNHRRMGIADELMKYICKYADVNLLSIRLEVREDNKGAILLYEKYGFIVVESHGNKLKMLRNNIL